MADLAVNDIFGHLSSSNSLVGKGVGAENPVRPILRETEQNHSQKHSAKQKRRDHNRSRADRIYLKIKSSIRWGHWAHIN